MGWKVSCRSEGGMGLVRRAAKVDANHAEVVESFRESGYLVLSLAAVGSGVPDLLVYRRDVGFKLIEVKRDEKAKLTPDQERFIAKGWPVEIVRGTHGS